MNKPQGKETSHERQSPFNLSNNLNQFTGYDLNIIHLLPITNVSHSIIMNNQHNIVGINNSSGNSDHVY